MSDPASRASYDKRTLVVQGKGRVSADPDVVVLHFDVQGSDHSYSGAVEDLNARVENLRSGLETVGIERDSLKTTSFYVQAKHEYDDGKRVFRGYRADHDLKLRLPLDKGMLNRALRHAAESASEPEIRISFDISDREPLRQRALERAVENARENAETLARAAGVRLLSITRIEYGAMEVEVRSHRNEYVMSEMSMGASAPDITPSELDAQDSVTVVWEIE